MAIARLSIADEAAPAEGRPGLLPVVICVLFALPLAFGLRSISGGVRLSSRASHFVHDAVSMYAQGVDFSRAENKNIVFDLARAQGLTLQPDRAVVILSTIRMVSDADCAKTPACTNRGLAVVEQQFVIGNVGLHVSAFGPGARDWLTDRAARVPDFTVTLRPGETIRAAEAWFATPEQPAGIYVRSMN